MLLIIYFFSSVVTLLGYCRGTDCSAGGTQVWRFLSRNDITWCSLRTDGTDRWGCQSTEVRNIQHCTSSSQFIHVLYFIFLESNLVFAFWKLREKIQHIDKSLVKDSLQIMRLERLRCNQAMVVYKVCGECLCEMWGVMVLCILDFFFSPYAQLKLMATVHQTQPTIQLLLSTPDYVAALELIATTQEILVQELAGVHSFRFVHWLMHWQGKIYYSPVTWRFCIPWTLLLLYCLYI